MDDFSSIPLTEAEYRFLQALIEQKVRFMVVGLSAAVLQGAPVVTQDVHLWFGNLNAPEFRKALQAARVTYVPPFELNPPMLAGEGVEHLGLVVFMHGLGRFDDEYPHALKMDFGKLPVKVLPLERIIASKEATGRPKDQFSVPVLRDTLSVKKKLAAKK